MMGRVGKFSVYYKALLASFFSYNVGESQLPVVTLKNENKRLGKWMYPDPHFWDAYLAPPGAKL